MKENKRFEIVSFLNLFSKKQQTIETKDIAKWLNINVRNIQKWAFNNDIPYHRIHGIKYYVWNKENLSKFKIWYERNNDKEVKKYYIPVKREDKVRPPFATIKDIIQEIDILQNKSEKTKIKYIQLWAKENDVLFIHLYGRKYYIITDEIKKKIIKSFK
jgi:hypothetical protein